MPFKGELSVSDDVRIEFTAHRLNNGATLMSTGYVPLPPNPSPAVTPPVIAIAAAGVGVQTTMVGPALTLIIDVDVPAGGGGQLEVHVNGALRDAGAFASDDNWSYLIV